MKHLKLINGATTMQTTLGLPSMFSPSREASPELSNSEDVVDKENEVIFQSPNTTSALSVS